MPLPEQALPLDNDEAETLLSVAMASTERSAFRLWCRLVDMSSLELGALGDRETADALA